MSIVPVSSLSASDRRSLGNNLQSRESDEPTELDAINRVLDVFDEGVDTLFRRKNARLPRQPRRPRRIAA